MSITHVNTKGKTYYLHQGVTKTGKPKYHFAMKSEGALVQSIPDGFEIYENPNAQVFLRRIPPKIITDEERQLVEDGMRQYASVKDYKIGRCFRAVDLLSSNRGREPPTRLRRAMMTQVLHCPYCQGTDIVRHGTSPEGKQRYRCRECLQGRGRTFLLDYAYAGQSPDVKQQIIEMAMNASGVRDTARVLHVSPTTVINELKKKNLSSTR